MLASLGVFSSVATQVHAQSLGVAAGYNLFVFEGATLSNTDAEGRIAIGGNAQLTNFGVGNKLNSGSAGNSLVVGGNLNYQNGEVTYGNVVYGGTSNNGYTVRDGTNSKGSPIDFSAARAELEGLSDRIADLSPTGTTTNSYGSLQFVGTDANLNTFLVQATDFNPAHTIQIDAPLGSTVLINIGGLYLDFDNLGISFTDINHDGTGVTSRYNVLYNFYEAQTLSISGVGVQGSILAPYANVNFSNGNIDGTLVAKSVTGGGEYHNHPFNGVTPVAVPEPSGLALLSLTFATLLGLRRRIG